MCGIAGVVRFKGGIKQDDLRKMCDEIAHRGPDGSGYWTSEDSRVGLGHRRLSIVDLSTKANQPMEDAQRKGVLVYNGEFYNHQTLRKTLIAQGFAFQTDHSDTETLLAGCLRLGPEKTLDHINGMFAFAFFDKAKGQLFLARDRVGIKPLYFTRLHDGFAFASEIKALLALDEVRPELDKEGFSHYLSFRSLPAPHTLFKGIFKLAPGSFLRIDVNSGEIQERMWWDVLQNPQLLTQSEEELCDQLEELLEDSVKLRTLADVPLGVFLSGGLDSAYLLKATSAVSGPLSTFTVYYPGHDQLNEHHTAAELARAASAHHHEIPIDPSRYFGALGEVSYYQDEPIAAPVCISVYLLSQAARQAGVPVIYTGEGSDELFLGYPNWLKVRDAQRLVGTLPDGVGRFMGKLFSTACLPFVGPQSRSQEFLNRIGKGQPLFWGGAMDFTQRHKNHLCGPEIQPLGPTQTYESVIQPFRKKFLDHRDARDITGWMSYLDLRFRLPELMLMRVDKMGMAFSIEGRVPFLDHRIVELATALPRTMRLARGRKTKRTLKAVLDRTMPHDFVHQRKRGFAAPMDQWKHNPFMEQLAPALICFAQRTGLLSVQGVTDLLELKDDRLYFSLINFMFWYCLFMENVLADFYPDPRQPFTQAYLKRQGAAV